MTTLAYFAGYYLAASAATIAAWLTFGRRLAQHRAADTVPPPPDLVDPGYLAVAKAAGVVPGESTPLYEEIRTVRVDMTTDLRIATGLADEDLEEWTRELRWTEAGE